jgi:hypothetical protein
MIAFGELIIPYNEFGKRVDRGEFAQSQCDHDPIRLYGFAARCPRFKNEIKELAGVWRASSRATASSRPLA